jgi:hypothetical protein
MDHDRPVNIPAPNSNLAEPDARGVQQKVTDTIVQYLYVHTPDERFTYPSSRAPGGAASVAVRYLECALSQAASLRLRDEPREIVLVTNLRDLRDAEAVTPRGVRMLEAMEKIGVRIVHADYEHRNRLPVESYASSRYLLDAINAVIDNDTDPDSRYWFTDLDCVWVDPDRVFAAAPKPGSVGCVLMRYPDDWNIEGTTPRRLGEFGTQLGECPVPVPWVGGELIAGTARDLKKLVADCDALDDRVGEREGEIPAEEHLLSLAGGLGMVDFVDMSEVAWRIHTGPRHEAPPHEHPETLGLWHLPSEKGLAFRRTANAVLRGRLERLQRDFEDPVRAMKRFNVAGVGLVRRVRDDGWLAMHRLRREFVTRTTQNAFA